jgi:hypothetical protein
MSKPPDHDPNEMPATTHPWREPSGWAQPLDPRTAPAREIAGKARWLAAFAQEIAKSTTGTDTRRIALARAAEDFAAIALRLESHFEGR